MVDVSTLAALKKHIRQLQEPVGRVLGGKMLITVEAFCHRPVAAGYEADATTHELHLFMRLGLLCCPQRSLSQPLAQSLDIWRLTSSA